VVFSLPLIALCLLRCCRFLLGLWLRSTRRASKGDNTATHSTVELVFFLLRVRRLVVRVAELGELPDHDVIILVACYLSFIGNSSVAVVTDASDGAVGLPPLLAPHERPRHLHYADLGVTVEWDEAARAEDLVAPDGPSRWRCTP
jgi:hypothetical protein